MGELFSAVLDWASKQGIAVSMLIIALVVMYKKQQKDGINNAAAIKEAWTAKEASELQRFSEMQSRLNASDLRHESCEKHRIELGAQLFQLALLTNNDELIGKARKEKNP